jgi:hypothetical protein
MKRNKPSKYMDRALKHRNPVFAKVLGRMGYTTRQLVAEPPTQVVETVREDDPSELTALRIEYQEVTDRKAYWGWDADTLRAKISEAKS